MTTPEQQRSSIRIASSAGNDVSGTGTKLLLLSTAVLWGLTGADPARSASTTHRRRRFAFKPRVSATLAIDTPVC